MAEFLVLEVEPIERRLLLMDRFGRFHAGRLFTAPPAKGATLHGCWPAWGVCLFSGPGGTPVYRVRMEVVNCSRDEMYGWMRQVGAEHAAVPARAVGAGRS